MPILIKFIVMMNKKYKDFLYIFHSTQEMSQLINSYVKDENISNCEVISDEKIKSHTLKKSVFAVAKSGTVSLEICKFKIPSVIIYKMNFINYLIVKSLVKIKYANIINFAAKEEIIPELLQTKCNPDNIFKTVSLYIDEPSKIKNQVEKTQSILNEFKSTISSADQARDVLKKYL